MRGQGGLKDYMKEPRDFKQNQIKHKGKHKIECYPKPPKSETLGINKNRPKYFKSETSMWKARNNTYKGHNKNEHLKYYTVSAIGKPTKGHNKNKSLVQYTTLTVYFFSPPSHQRRSQ